MATHTHKQSLEDLAKELKTMERDATNRRLCKDGHVLSLYWLIDSYARDHRYDKGMKIIARRTGKRTALMQFLAYPTQPEPETEGQTERRDGRRSLSCNDGHILSLYHLLRPYFHESRRPDYVDALMKKASIASAERWFEVEKIRPRKH